MKSLRNAAALLAMALVATQVLSHHSFAMFDQSQRITLKGTVSEFQWTNPHAFIELDVAGPDANAGHWQLELNSPNNLKRQGWASSSLKSGDAITVTLNPLRDMSEQKGGLFITLTKADGTVLSEAAFARGRGPVNVPTIPADK
jgi:Family of unknown function (DUF6152)